MISVIVPVYNEERAVVSTLVKLSEALKGLGEHEIICVNDGSTDSSLEKIKSSGIKGLRIVEHPENLGYGKSLFDGIMAAKYGCIAIIDADGSYPAERIKDLYAFYPKYDMIVGARQGKEYGGGAFKRPARLFFNFLVEYASGRKVADVNSGLRIFKRDLVLKFKDSLCPGFSFTTTLTLIFLLNHYYVKYVPVTYLKRQGRSKVRHFIDTLRAGQIIVETFLYYNPVKLFLLLACANVIAGLIIKALNNFYIHSTYLDITSAICVSSFIPLFCVGLISDQLKKIYKISGKDQ